MNQGGVQEWFRKSIRFPGARGRAKFAEALLGVRMFRSYM